MLTQTLADCLALVVNKFAKKSKLFAPITVERVGFRQREGDKILLGLCRNGNAEYRLALSGAPSGISGVLLNAEGSTLWNSNTHMLPGFLEHIFRGWATYQHIPIPPVDLDDVDFFTACGLVKQIYYACGGNRYNFSPESLKTESENCTYGVKLFNHFVLMGKWRASGKYFLRIDGGEISRFDTGKEFLSGISRALIEDSKLELYTESEASTPLTMQVLDALCGTSQLFGGEQVTSSVGNEGGRFKGRITRRYLGETAKIQVRFPTQTSFAELLVGIDQSSPGSVRKAELQNLSQFACEIVEQLIYGVRFPERIELSEEIVARSVVRVMGALLESTPGLLPAANRTSVPIFTQYFGNARGSIQVFSTHEVRNYLEYVPENNSWLTIKSDYPFTGTPSTHRHTTLQEALQNWLIPILK